MNTTFDRVHNRKNTDCLKWDFTENVFDDDGVLPLWIADMDFEVAPEILDALQKRVQHGLFGYTGLSEHYFNACSTWYQTQHQILYHPEWMTFAPTIVQALHFVVKTFTKPGDSIVIQPPVYHPFFDAITNNQCEVVENPLIFNNGHYEMDFDDLESTFKSSNAKLMILCSPHNPVGRVWTEGELNRLSALCAQYNVLLVSDEIHCDLTYSGYKHIPTMSVFNQLDHVITFVSASKTFNLGGLQVATVIIPNIEHRNAYNQTLTKHGITRPNIFAMTATEAAYSNGITWFTALKEYLEGNLTYVRLYIQEHMPLISLIEPEGTYLLWLDFSGLELNDSLLKEFIIKEAKLGLDFGVKFGAGGSGYARMNIATQRVQLELAMKNLHTAMTTHLLRRKQENETKKNG